MGLRPKKQLTMDDPSEKLPPAERQRLLSRRLASTVRFAYAHAEPVRRKLDAAGVSPSQIRTLKDLERIPVTTKDELVSLQKSNPPFGGLLTVPVNSLSKVYVSPGPIYDVFERDQVESFARALKAAGFANPGDVVLVSTAFHMVPAGLVFTDALELLGATVIPAGIGQTELQVQIARDLKVTGYCGFPSFLMSLVKKAEEMGYDVRRDLSLRWAIGAGERHLQLVRQELEQDYGIQMTQFYGTGDAGLLAFECLEKNGMHYNDQDAVIEIIDPDNGRQVAPGEEGQVVVTMLNKTYPLIRFGTGDLAYSTDDPCPCGRTSPRLMAITGMIGDHVRAKGMFIHGRELEEAMSGFPQVSKYQLVLSLDGHRDRIALRVETSEPIDRESLAGSITMRCKEVFRLTVDTVDFMVKGELPDDNRKFVDQRFR